MEPVTYNYIHLETIARNQVFTPTHIETVKQLIMDNPELLFDFDVNFCSSLQSKLIASGVLQDDLIYKKIDYVSSILKTNLSTLSYDISNTTTLLEKLTILDETKSLVIYRNRLTWQDTFCLEQPRTHFQYAKSFGINAPYQIHELPDDVLKIVNKTLLNTYIEIDLFIEKLLHQNSSREDVEKGLEQINSLVHFAALANNNPVVLEKHAEILGLLNLFLEKDYGQIAGKLLSKSFYPLKVDQFDIASDIKESLIKDYFEPGIGLGKIKHKVPNLVAVDFPRFPKLLFNGKILFDQDSNEFDNANLAYETLAFAFGEELAFATVTPATCLFLTQGIGFGSLGRKAIHYFNTTDKRLGFDHRLFEIKIDENRLITIIIKTLCYQHESYPKATHNFKNPVAICAKFQMPADELEEAVLQKNAKLLKNLQVEDMISVPLLRKGDLGEYNTKGTAFDDEDANEILKNLKV